MQIASAATFPRGLSRRICLPLFAVRFDSSPAADCRAGLVYFPRIISRNLSAYESLVGAHAAHRCGRIVVAVGTIPSSRRKRGGERGRAASSSSHRLARVFQLCTPVKGDRSPETKAAAINPGRERARETRDRERNATQKGLLPLSHPSTRRGKPAETRLRRNRRVEAKRGIIRI